MNSRHRTVLAAGIILGFCAGALLGYFARWVQDARSAAPMSSATRDSTDGGAATSRAPPAAIEAAPQESLGTLGESLPGNADSPLGGSLRRLDTQDLMRRARNAFQQSGNLDKALWLHGEIMKKFPEHRAGDLHLLAILEKRMKKYDDAMHHFNESVELAATDQDRVSRLLSRAELVHEREGDSAGLEAYRELERLARAAGIETADEAGKRADRIEERLATR